MVRKVTKEDIAFLLEERFAFLIITSLGLKEVEEGTRIAEEMNLATLMGWPVCYTPGQDQHRLSCASGHLREELFDEDHGPTAPVENHDDAKFNSQRQQLFKSAGEMVLLVIEQGWEGVKIEDGSALFKWAMWAHCTSNNLKIEGYDPTDEDFERLKRCEVLFEPYIYQHTLSYVPTLGATESADIPGGDEQNNPSFVATVDQDTPAPAAEEKSSDSVAEEPQVTQTTESEKTPAKKKSVATKKKKATLKAVDIDDATASPKEPSGDDQAPKADESNQESAEEAVIDDVLNQDNESTEPSIEVTERTVESHDEEDKSVDTLKSPQSTDEIPKDDSNPPETSEQTGSTEQKTKDPFKFDIDSLTDEEKKLLDQEDDDTDNTS